MNTETTNIAKVDLETFTNFQKRLHDVDPADETDAVFSPFSYTLKKCTWSAQVLAKLKCETTTDYATFTPDPKMNFLLYTYLVQKLPAQKVLTKAAKQIRICWPPNLAHNIFNFGQFCYDSEPANTIDSVWMDIERQFFADRGAGKRDHYNMQIGNIPILQSWGTFLPEYDILIIPPWSYSKHTVLAVRLFMCSLCTVTHRIKLRRKIRELLRMQMKGTDNEWKDIPYNFKYIEGAVSGDDELPPPTMWGKYAQILDSEQKWLRETENTVYIRDVIAKSSDQTFSYGSVVPLDIYSESPVTAMFWVAENIQATQNRNFSNYTTNSADMTRGWNPIKNIKEQYGGIDRLKDLDSIHFDGASPLFDFPSAPHLPGYNAYALGYNPADINADIGIVFKGLSAKFLATLDNSDPFLRRIGYQQDRSEEESSKFVPEELQNAGEAALKEKYQGTDQFRLHLRMLVIKKLVYTNGKCEIVTEELAG